MKILHTGDLHIGNPKAKASIIHDNLRKHMYPLLPEIDMLIIAGDTADRGLAFDSSPSRIITAFLMEICTLSKIHDFVIRIISGTWSHDRNSIRIINRIAKSKGVSDRVKYFDTIEIEYIERFNKSFIFIPDDVPFIDLESRVISKIKDTPTGTVDIGVFHGMMKHVLPYMPKEPVNTINADNWAKYINDVCCCNHIHQRSIYKGKFIYSGSFDRNCHGDEGTKGFFLINLEEGKSPRIDFVENPDAHVFKSLDLNDKNISDGISFLTKSISKCVEARQSVNIPIYIRILIDDVITKAALMNYTSSQYKNTYNVKISYKSEKTDVYVEEEDIEDEELLIVTPDNLAEIISNRINNKLSATEVSDILKAA